MVLKQLVDGFRSLVPGRRGDLPGLYDRRDQVRLRCHYQVECKLGPESFNGIALDIGANGFRLGVARKLEKDMEVLVSYRPGGVPVGRQRLRCQVVWSRPDEKHGFTCGCKFVDTPENVEHSWALKVLHELGFDPRTVIRRKAMRVDSQLAVRIQDLDTDREMDGNVINIGVGGALIRTEGSLEPNARLQLTIGPLERMKPLPLLARVLSRRKDPADEETHLVGVRFLNHQNTPEIKLLGDYVIRLLRDSLP